MNDLDQRLLQMLLAGDDPVLSMLRGQLDNATQRPKELSGVGFFIHFDVSEQALRIPGDPSFNFGDVIGEIEGLEHGVGFVLFVEKGLLAMLEGYTYGEQLPSELSSYELKYIGGETRDLSALRATPGWPIQLY